MSGGPEVVPVREAPSAPHGQPLPPPGAAFAPPGAGLLDEPPPIGVRAPAPAARLSAGFWPVPCLLVADDGGGRLRIAVAGGTTVHAVMGATVRTSREPVVEIETLEGRRFRYAPVTDVRVAPGDVLKPGAVLGRVAGEHAAQLELAVRDPDGRWVDPYPLLVGLADPNELGVDARTGDGVDPDSVAKRAPEPAPEAEHAPTSEPSPPLAVAPAESPPPPTVAPAEPPPPPPPPPVAETPPPPPPPRVSDDILAAMVAPSPPPRAEPAEE
jgi:hypothetical protein